MKATRNEYGPQDLGHGITLVDAEYQQPGYAALYLMRQGDDVAIIETGTAHSLPGVLTCLSSWGLPAENVKYIIPTHVHLDHAGGAGELMHRCPRATLVAHPRGARHLIDPTRLIESSIAVYGKEKFHRLYGKLKPVDANRVIEAPDGYMLDFSGRELRFLDTPGHTRHHFCVHDEASRGIFSGDTFGLGYRGLNTEKGPFIFATTTPVQFEPEAMVASIERLLSLNPESIYLTHYGEITPTRELVAQLKESIRVFTEIALDESAPAEGRHGRMARRMMAHLLSTLAGMNCPKTPEFCRALLQNDVTLNCQGLEIWLARRK